MTAGLVALAAGLAVAIAAVGSATAQGKTAVAALDAIWRQPDATADVRGTFMLALAFQEALTIFVMLISLILALKVTV